MTVTSENVNLTERPEDTVRRFANRLVLIEELHAARVRDVDGYQLRWCRECGQNWPCPTVEALHADVDDAPNNAHSSPPAAQG